MILEYSPFTHLKPISDIGVVDTKVYRRFSFRNKTDGVRGHLGRGETGLDCRCSEERLFTNSPAVWMTNDERHRGSVLLPYLLAVYDPVLKECLGVLKKIPQKIRIDLSKRDASW